ncbi:MAG: aminoacyl-tRNA deacylase [Bradyrhizobium icense]|nr:MAG: aminoacyl-tRNA deacylase [Bradyrhizobium icense]
MLSIQVAILKILASHISGCATLPSLNRDIAILTASGNEWKARIRRLAARVPDIDLFGTGYVLRGDDGWQITAAGRDFLAMLESVTQDNLPHEDEPGLVEPLSEPRARGDLIVVGHRFRNRVHRPGAPMRKTRAVSRAATGSRGENASG